jgi:glyoxylase-like metal-dependent hydrolase (beta-lactamase superfamily II)
MKVAQSMHVELIYPHAAPPAHDSWIEVAPSIRWLRFPLPFQLNHINLWLLEDGDGWCLVDTGIKSDESYALWAHHVHAALDGKPINRLIVTHFHPDHVGCAERIVEIWRPEFLCSRTEWLTATMLQTEIGSSATSFWGDYIRSAGLDEEMVAAVALRGENYGQRVGAIPRPFTRLADGDHLRIGGRDWTVVTGTGHSPELICLYAAADRLFISSDQVLPGISPNISVAAVEPTGDPLTEFLTSCRKLRMINPESLVMPMHGKAFYRLHERLDELERHHADRLDLTLAACREPLTIVDLLSIMFKRKLDFQQTQFAIGEAMAHTNHLVTAGAMERIQTPGQPLRFRTLPGAI